MEQTAANGVLGVEMKRLLRKLVQGLSTAMCAVGGATLAVSAIDGELYWFGLDAALRVGVPAFVMGLVFFPVDFKALERRGVFTLRALAAASLSCAAHRVLLWAARADGPYPLELVPTLTGDGPLGIDVTAWLAVLATSGAAAAAWLAQPALLRLARSPRLDARWSGAIEPVANAPTSRRDAARLRA